MKTQAALQYGYWFLLGALVLLTAYRAYITTFRGSLPMIRTVAAMLAVGLLSLALAYGGNWVGEDYALAMMAADGVAAGIVLIHPAGRAQSVIGLTFLLQMGVYLARLFSGSSFDPDVYWWLLTVLAMLQLLVAGGWIASEHFAWRAAVPGRRIDPDPAYRKGVGG